MDVADQPKGRKRKPSVDKKEKPIPFKVFKHPTEGSYVLKISKPSNPDWDKGLEVTTKDCCDVCLINECADNIHGLDIMYKLNHKNIVRMEAVSRKSCRENQISVFIEKCRDDLLAHCWKVTADSFGQIPSETFQAVVREIISGIEFLRKNGTYHGNLSWETTLFKWPYTVKLFGLKKKDVPLIQAQFEDWENLADMLQDVSIMASENVPRLICGDVDVLIAIIRTSNMNSLPTMADSILESVFFWTPGKRTKLMMTVVPVLLKNSKFCARISNSAICSVPWDSNDRNRPLRANLAERFKAILDKCNSYRTGLPIEISKFDPEEKIDCLRLAYAAYTHQKQLNEQVDFIFRAKFPQLFSQLQRAIRNL